MANLHIRREHALGLKAARKVAHKWAEEVQAEFGMECSHEEGMDADLVRFSRSGVEGTLNVLADQFVLEAKLGFLLGAFKGRIEAEIVKNLDALLAAKPVKRTQSAKKPSSGKT